jgi:hypothetical protein
MWRRSALGLLVLLAAGCTTVRLSDDLSGGAPPLCQGRDLGTVAVLPETRWRPDQKEPENRRRVAEAGIASAFQAVPCANATEIRSFAEWSRLSETTLRATAAQAGVTTLVFVRIEELGPLLEISLPVLWSTHNDFKLNLRAVDVRSGATLLDVTRRRQVGGAFQLRGTEPLQGELEAVLRSLSSGSSRV